MKQKNTFEGKAFRVLFIVLADLFIVFSVIIIGYDSVFSPEFPVSIGAFFLILLLWLNLEMVVQYFWRANSLKEVVLVMKQSVEDISTAIEESAKGIANAAENTDILVENMDKVKKKMETNQQISDQLKAESDRFQGISDNLML